MGHIEDAANAIIAASQELSAAPCQEVLRQVEACNGYMSQAGEIVAQQCAPRLQQIQAAAEELQAIILSSQEAFQQAGEVIAAGGSLSGSV